MGKNGRLDWSGNFSSKPGIFLYYRNDNFCRWRLAKQRDGGVKIGFIQGRLSPLIDGKIQAFPWEYWQDEFKKAKELGLHLMEWTLDQSNLYENPIMNENGQRKIKSLCKEFEISIPSLTGDCFMQAPFYKKRGEESSQLIRDFQNIILSCGKVGVEFIVFPLVDGGRIENQEQQDYLLSTLHENTLLLKDQNVKIVFESDFSPKELKSFISKLPQNHFGINYDSGNSSALGFDPVEELSSYGDRVLNVHIKDRKFKGTTVPLGEGDTRFVDVFKMLSKYKYKGNWILQTARSENGKHQEVLQTYAEKVKTWYQNEF